MTTLIARDIAFRFDGASAPLFSYIHFSFSPHVHALVGRSGVGKSIFLRLLAGQLAPTVGEIVTNATTIGYLSQHAELHGTVADIIGLTTLRRAHQAICSGDAGDAHFALLDGQWDFEDKALQVLDCVQLPADILTTDFMQLSGGQQTKARLASLLMQDCDVLLLDEPSNHLDATTRAWLADFLASQSKPSIIVTHDTRLLNVANTVSELTPTALHTSTGGWGDYQVSRAIQLDTLDKQVSQHTAQLRQAKRQQQIDRERLERKQNKAKKSRATANHAKSQLDFRAERSDKTQSRLTTLHEQRIDAQHALLNDAKAELARISPLAMSPSEPKKVSSPVVQLSAVTLPFGTEQSITLQLNANDRVALTGKNGAGKSTLLRVLTNDIAPKSGDVQTTQSRVMLDQHLSLLDYEQSALENFRQLSPSTTWQESDYRTVLAQLRLRGDKALLPVNALSGGERLKTALACVFLGETAPALLLLDEPDNHLDLESKALLASTLAKYRGAVLMVSHDEEFVQACGITDHIVL